MFCLDSTCFATGNRLKFLTLLLNSPLGRYLLKDSPKTGTGDLLISVQAIEPILVPTITDEVNNSFEMLFELCSSDNGQGEGNKLLNEELFNLYGFSAEEREYIMLF